MVHVAKEKNFNILASHLSSVNPLAPHSNKPIRALVMEIYLGIHKINAKKTAAMVLKLPKA